MEYLDSMNSRCNDMDYLGLVFGACLAWMRQKVLALGVFLLLFAGVQGAG